LTITSEEFAKNNIILNFEGLDTYADVYLNDKLILQANNMFRTWEINVKPLVKLGANQLRVLLHSPVKKGLEILAASPYGYPANNDQSELGGLGDKKISVFTRKAGYHYGWDWGPRLVTSGIWRPVILKAWNGIRITDSYIKQPKVTKELASLVADVKVQIDAPFSGTIQILDSKTKKVYTSSKFDFKAGLQTISLPFAIKKPKLWWSKGLGDPNLYQFDIVVTDNNNNRIGKKEVTTGL
jgi:beta-mannosidase